MAAMRNPVKLIQMTKMRLNIDTDANIPLAYYYPIQVDEAKVVVFILANKSPMIIETEADLFPNDGFITQLRLLIEAK